VSTATDEAPAGGCTCGHLRYSLTAPPLIVHGCHCRWCQRETGSALAINALIETAELAVTAGRPDRVPTPSLSGRGQLVVRCPDCHVAVWSHYPGLGEAVAFVRVGTLDAPDRFPPDIHIFTASKQPWLRLPEGLPAVAEYYDREAVWPVESLRRLAAVRG